MQFAESSSLSAPPARTGAPGEFTCANTCHTGNLNTGPGIINFSLEGKMYRADSVITISVEINDSTKSRFGFQLTALDGNDNKAGEFTIGPKTSISTGLGREYISHQNANGTKSWQFNWTAPNTNVGALTFYLAMNAANNNGTTSGDNIYTKEFIIDPTSPVSLKEFYSEKMEIDIFPNPVQSFFSVSFPNHAPSITSIQLFDLNGKLAQQFEVNQQSTNNKTTEYNLDEKISSGLFILKLEMINGIFVKKILII